MGGFPFEPEDKSRGSKSGNPRNHDYLTEREGRHIVKPVNLVNMLLFYQLAADLCAVADLFGMLKEEVNVIIRTLFIYGIGECGKAGAVPVVPAFMRYARGFAAVRQAGAALIYRQSIEIRTEGDTLFRRFCAVDSIEPCAHIADPEGCACTEIVHEDGFCIMLHIR